MNNAQQRSIRSLLVLAASSLAIAAGAASAAPSDAQLAAAVKTAVAQAGLKQAGDLKVNVQDGTVYFGGWAYDNAEVLSAISAARSVDGVQAAYGVAVHTWDSK
jgi:osmotically-inducible protein OsmY